MSESITINLAQGSLSFRFTPSAARELRSAIERLLSQLKTKGPTPQPNMEYQHAGEVFLEVFCNPNIWPTPFAARVLITLRDERIRASAETELTGLVEDLNFYLEQHG
jgi:hypothetical protein